MNYRQPDSWKNNYQKNKQILNSRTNQPERLPRGNYRVDSQGNPLPSSRSQSFDDYDYFDRERRDEEKRGQDQIYYIDDYQPRRSTQSQSNPNYRDDYTDSQYRSQSQAPPYRPRGNRYLNEDRRTVNPQRPYSRAYHRILDQLTKNKSQGSASLPKGKFDLLITFAIIYLIIFISAYQISPTQLVNSVSVDGNSIVPDTLILDSSRIHSLDNYQEVMTQRNSIEDVIKSENPMIESVEFRRPNWQGLELQVQEYDFIGYVRQGDGIYPVITNGEIMDASQHIQQIHSVEQSLPELIGFNTTGERIDVAKGLRQIDSSIIDSMNKIYNTSEPNKPNAIEVHMKDGNIVKAITSTFSQKMQHYPQILSQIDGQTGLINLEVGSYFTPDVSSANSIKLDDN